MKTMRAPLKQNYPLQVVEALAGLLEKDPQWVATAAEAEAMVVDNGLLPVSALPLSRASPLAFSLNLILDQDSVLENSNLLNLEEQGWDPQEAANALDLVGHLLL